MAKKKDASKKIKQPSNYENIRIPWDFLGSELNRIWETTSAKLTQFSVDLELAYAQVSILYYANETTDSEAEGPILPDTQYSLSRGDYEIATTSNGDKEELPPSAEKSDSDKIGEYIDGVADENFDFLLVSFDSVQKDNADLVNSSVGLKIIVKSAAAIAPNSFRPLALRFTGGGINSTHITISTVVCMRDRSCPSKRKYKNGRPKGCC